MDRKVTIYEHDETVISLDNTTGEVNQQHSKRYEKVKLPPEPPFVKLYLDCLSKFKGLQLSLNPILMAMLDNSKWSNPNEESGMRLYLNKALKEEIANRCGVGLKRVEQAITEFVKKGIMVRVAAGTYDFNPFLFGKGKWENIYNIRATFDFGKNEVIADIVKREEEEMTKNQNELDNVFRETIIKSKSETMKTPLKVAAGGEDFDPDQITTDEYETNPNYARHLESKDDELNAKSDLFDDDEDEDLI